MKFNVQSLFAQMPLRVFVLSLFTVACLFAFAPPAQAGGGELWMRNLHSLQPTTVLRADPWGDKHMAHPWGEATSVSPTTPATPNSQLESSNGWLQQVVSTIMRVVGMPGDSILGDEVAARAPRRE